MELCARRMSERLGRRRRHHDLRHRRLSPRPLHRRQHPLRLHRPRPHTSPQQRSRRRLSRRASTKASSISPSSAPQHRFHQRPAHAPLRRQPQGRLPQLPQVHGLKANSDWLIEGNHALDGGRDAMQKILALPNWPTAIMCSNDMTAIGVQHALFEANLRVPRRLLPHRLRRHPSRRIHHPAPSPRSACPVEISPPRPSKIYSHASSPPKPSTKPSQDRHASHRSPNQQACPETRFRIFPRCPPPNRASASPTTSVRFCPCLSFCHSLWESASSFAFAVALAVARSTGLAGGFSPLKQQPRGMGL